MIAAPSLYRSSTVTLAAMLARGVRAASRAELPQAKAAPRAKATPARRRAVMWSSAGALALAAAVLLFVFFGRGHSEEAGGTSAKTTTTVSAPRATQPIPLVTCPDGLEQEKCVEEQRHS